MVARTDKAVARRKLAKAKSAATRRQWISEQKSKPCHDCEGVFPAYCMDFDHRPGEIKSISIGKDGHSASFGLLVAEIAKCDIVCANCHRVRTFERLKNT